MIFGSKVKLDTLEAGSSLIVDGYLCSIGKRGTYSDGEYTLIEYEVLGHNRYSHIEWSPNEPNQVSCTLKKLQFTDIFKEVKNSEQYITSENFLKEEIVYNGGRFSFDEKWSAMYREGQASQEVTMYDFKSASGTYITIESWDSAADEKIEVYHSEQIDISKIKLA